MLKIVIPTAMLVPTALLLKPKLITATSTTYTFLLALTSLTYLKQDLETKHHTSMNLNADSISAPLLSLSYWLLPLMIMASQNTMTREPLARQRAFLFTMFSLQTTVASTFMTTNLVTMYIMFEATLIPTLIIITRWGHQAERLTAGSYFILYTLTSSMPLLIAILYLNSMTQAPTPFFLPTMLEKQPQMNNILWLACLMAFMVKLPMYGVHLWLPKAHVEAPIAGSMVLAAVLLKLGGFGAIRVMQTLPPADTSTLVPLIALSLWGAMMTSLTCLQQTDLKSLIAYSSVSHMGLIIAAIMTQSSSGLTGAMILMIAHGFSSSMLFCLANTNYERTNTRMLTLTRGLHAMMPTMTSWWLFASLMNMALPPTANFTGELTIMSTMFSWSPYSSALLGPSILITATYSLNMLAMTQAGKPTMSPIMKTPSHTREHLLMALHITPLLLLSLKPELMT